MFSEGIIMSLVEKIKQIYAELQNDEFGPRGTIRVEEVSGVQYIAKWEHPTLQRPTDEQLAEIN